jgi:hypothetical protein
VIVRIATEDQFEIPEDAFEEINDLDNQIVEAVEAGDEARFKETFAKLVDLVHSRGKKLADDDLRESQVIIPPSDISIEEARADFSGDGVIPEEYFPSR